MKYTVHHALIRPGPALALLVVGFSVQAMAQFEIAPDHFDSNPSVEKKQAVKPPTAKPRAQVAASPANAANTKAQGPGQNALVAHNGQPGTATAIARSQSSAVATKSTAKKQAARQKKRATEKVASTSTH